MKNFDEISEWIGLQEDEAVGLQDLLTRNVAMSPESGGQGEECKVSALESWLRERGICDLTRIDAPDERVESKVRPSLVATIKGESSRALWIIAHTDVVPAGEMKFWRTDPFRLVREGDRLFGRGVEDNQQGIVSAAIAAMAFAKNKIAPRLTLKLLFVADEEFGSKFGMHFILKTQSLFSKDDLILIPDGGDFLGAEIEIAEKNILWATFRTKGKQAHGSCPDEGINAHLANCALALEIHALEKKLSARDPLFSPPYSTIQPTRHLANVPNINTIPGEDSFSIDCRILPQYPLDLLREEISSCVKKIEREYGVQVEVVEEQAEQSKATPQDAPVSQALAEAVREVYKVEPKFVGIGGGTVAACLRNKGFDAAVWSRMEETCHQPNESCLLPNILGNAKVFARMLC